MFEGYFSHKINIEARLELLYYLICGTKEEIDFKLTIIDDIWDLFILNGNKDEIKIIHNFFLKTQENM